MGLIEPSHHMYAEHGLRARCGEDSNFLECF
jgi:hypothetical protein